MRCSEHPENCSITRVCRGHQCTNVPVPGAAGETRLLGYARVCILLLPDPSKRFPCPLPSRGGDHGAHGVGKWRGQAFLPHPADGREWDSRLLQPDVGSPGPFVCKHQLPVITKRSAVSDTLLAKHCPWLPSCLQSQSSKFFLPQK